MTEWVHTNAQWKEMRFDKFFDMLPTNTLSRDKLNSQRGEYQNIHYGDVLIKYPYCLDCNNNEIPYINDGVKFNATEVKDGDVIFADTAEDDTVGKCVEMLNVGDRRIVSGLHTYFCRPKYKMAPGYLGYFLNSDHFHNQLLPYIAGSKVSSVNRTSISRTCIFYPDSLPAQRRIAAILFSADKVIASTQKVIAKYKQMKQGLMEDLLKPKEGWKMVRLGECCTIHGRIGFRGYTTDDLVEKGYGAITFSPSDIHGYKLCFDDCDYISWKKYEESPEIKVYNGDILFCKTASIGKCAFVENLKEKATINPQFVVLKDFQCDSRFLYYKLTSYEFQTQVQGITGGSTIKTMSQEKLGLEMICIPSSHIEQQRIASILSGIDAKIAAEEKVLEKYGKIKKGLMERLLNENE